MTNAAAIMTSLLSRLQSATGPSRELDAEIALANGWMRGNVYWHDPAGKIFPDDPPRYTESIDAALTLFPESWTYWELRSPGHRTSFSAGIYRLIGDDEQQATGHGATPALALLVAVERAKEESKP